MTSSNGNISASLAIYAGNSPVTGKFHSQRPVTRSSDVFFDLRPNKQLSKQWWGWWFETPLCPLWRHCHAIIDHQPAWPAKPLPDTHSHWPMPRTPSRCWLRPHIALPVLLGMRSYTLPVSFPVNPTHSSIPPLSSKNPEQRMRHIYDGTTEESKRSYPLPKWP